MASPVYPPTITTNILVNTRLNPKIVYLPAASTIGSGKLLFVKDMCGNAGVSSIYLSTTGLDTLDYRFRPSTLYGLMSTNFQSVLLASDGQINWMILQNYISNVIKRDFSPRQISGLQLWLDANDPYATGSLPANNTVITSWIDKSGGGNNIAGFNSPRWYASPSRMSNSANAYFSGASPTSYNMIAFFVYLDANTPQTCAPIYTANDPAATDITGIFPNCGGTTFVQTSGGWATQGASITDATSNIVSLQYSSASNTNNVLVYFNGTLNFTTSSSSFSRTSYTLGRRVNEYMTGNFYETLFYNTIPTTLERQQLEGYLAWKWGLQGNLPANHPYRNGPP